MRTIRALTALALALSLACPAAAQRRRGEPRVIQLDDPGCFVGLRRPSVMFVGAADACPGATLLRLCGGSAPTDGTCPEIDAAVAALGVDRLAQCRADPALVPAAFAVEEATFDSDALRSAVLLFGVVARIRGHEELGLIAQLATRLRMPAAPPSDLMRTIMGWPGLDPQMRALAIELFSHRLADPHDDDDGFHDVSFTESLISRTRLPDMPGANDVAWHTIELLLESAQHERLLRALDTYRDRWPLDRVEERDAIQARALIADSRATEARVHLRASALRCTALDGGRCRGHFRGELRTLLLASLRRCRTQPVEPSMVRRCMRDALEAETLLESDTPRSEAADITETIRWASVELGDHPTSASPAPMRTPPPASSAEVLPGFVDTASVWRTLRRRTDEIRRCGPVHGGALVLRLEVTEQGVLSVQGHGHAAACLRRGLAGRRSVGSEGGVGLAGGTLVFAPR